jgi:hypothetical protein
MDIYLEYKNDYYDYDDIAINEYTYYDCAYAILSSVELIQRSVKMSSIPLNSIVILFNGITHMHMHMHRFINYNIITCELLRNIGIDSLNLLKIAVDINDIPSMTFLINNMSAIYLSYILEDKTNRYIGTVLLLVIERIQDMYPKDGHLRGLIHRHLLYGLSKNIYNNMTYEFFNRKTIIPVCYYIIKYMSYEEGKSYMAEQNNLCDNNISRVQDPQIIEDITNIKTQYNTLLEFHLRPRGTHTKSASTTF